MLGDLQLEVIFEIGGQHANQPAPDTSQQTRRTVGDIAQRVNGSLNAPAGFLGYPLWSVQTFETVATATPACLATSAMCGNGVLRHGGVLKVVETINWLTVPSPGCCSSALSKHRCCGRNHMRKEKSRSDVWPSLNRADRPISFWTLAWSVLSNLV